MTDNKATSKKVSELAVTGILEKKGHDIVVLDLKGIDGAICDYFVICHGTSRPQVEAIMDSVDWTIKKETGQNPFHVEGTQNAEWVLVDYVDVVVHIFIEEKRQFYKLESLWADAPKQVIEDPEKN